MTGKMFDLDNNHTGCGYGHNVYVYRSRQDGRWIYKVRLRYLVDNMVVDSILMASIDPGALQCMVSDNLKHFVASKQSVIVQYVEEQLLRWDWTE